MLKMVPRTVIQKYIHIDIYSNIEKYNMKKYKLHETKQKINMHRHMILYVLHSYMVMTCIGFYKYSNYIVTRQSIIMTNTVSMATTYLHKMQLWRSKTYTEAWICVKINEA